MRQSFPEFDYYLSPDGQKFFFNDSHNFIYALEGYGFPDIEYVTQRGLLQQGVTVVNYQLRERIIQMSYHEETDTRWDYWDRRNEFIDMFRPNRSPNGAIAYGSLTKNLPDGTARRIDVLLQDGPKFTHKTLGMHQETVLTDVIRFMAPDPTFYDPTLICLSWILTATDHLVFPFVFGSSGILFQSSVISDIITVNYSGTFATFPIIIIQGPMSGILVENLSTDEFLRLDYDVTIGETITIDLRYGMKTAISSLGTNITGTISEDSDLATFHLAPSGEVSGGVNQIRVSGGNAQIGVTIAQIAYYTRYIGI